METIELFYPEINVKLGSYALDKGVEVEVYSSKSSYFDWAKIKFTKQFNEKLSINKKDAASIEMGYQGKLESVFEGYVTRPFNTTNSNEIVLKDDMILLEETYINNTFLDATPQEILKFCLNKAGISKMKISTKAYQKKKTVPIFKKNVISVIEEIHSIWKIKENFYFLDKTFYWGEKPLQSKIYTLEYGVNIVKLDRANDMWELETLSVPFIKHSQKINVIHPRFTAEAETKKIVFTTNDAGFIRTQIYF